MAHAVDGLPTHMNSPMTCSLVRWYTEPSRRKEIYQSKTFVCFHLADELRRRGWNRIDYMTIDTEGSELELVLDFPWHDFDVRIVQVEQLSESKYLSQKGRKDAIVRHLQQFGYKLLSVYEVEQDDTDDLILTSPHVDKFLAQTLAHPRDGDYYQRQDRRHPQQPRQQSVSDYVARIGQQERQQLDQLLDMPLDEAADPQAILQRRKFLANEALKARKRKNNGT